MRKDTPKDKTIRKIKANMAKFLLDNVYTAEMEEEWIEDILRALKEQLYEEIVEWIKSEE